MGLHILRSINGLYRLINVQLKIHQSMSQLTSCTKMNIADNNTARYAIAKNTYGHNFSLQQINKNRNSGISLAQIAEGLFNEIGNRIAKQISGKHQKTLQLPDCSNGLQLCFRFTRQLAFNR